ncbi:MAG: S1 RNA-binding domain-containing protein [archaeon]
MVEQKPAQVQKKWPQIGENVICRVTKILNYGVFAELVEYPGAQGFVHISQVSPSWIKNIRNFVKENQVRVGKVVHIDLQKGQVDVSFNKVTAGVERSKLEDYRQAKRSQKLLEVIARQSKTEIGIAEKEIGEPLVQAYGSLFTAFQAIAVEGESALEEKVDKRWFKPIIEIISKSISVPEKTVKGTISISHNGPNGAEVIREVLSGAKSPDPDAKGEITYLGSGKWLLKVTSMDFKESEKALKQIAESVIVKTKRLGGSAGFEKTED